MSIKTRLDKAERDNPEPKNVQQIKFYTLYIDPEKRAAERIEEAATAAAKLRANGRLTTPKRITQIIMELPLEPGDPPHGTKVLSPRGRRGEE